MQYSTVALLAFVAAASAQTPPGCQTSFSGTFEISPKNISSTAKRDLNIYKRQGQACTSTPVITLQDGKLTDQDGRTGEIVANEQFQFDNPIQENSLFISGFSICENGTLAIGGSAVFYSCLSGTFDNLYHESQGGQCFPVFIDTIPCVGPSGSAAPETASSTPVASSSSSAVSVTPASSTPVTTSSTPVVTSAPTSSMAPLTMTMAAPFPVANSTTVATGTAVASTAPTKATTSAPATFTPGSGANMLAAGSKVFAAMVGFVAFAMF